tara:strand:+ start:3249 stop:4517 length:1269 start_codon:yes stop_codon:yes gene_type:complete
MAIVYYLIARILSIMTQPRLVYFLTTFCISILSPELNAQPFVPASADYVVDTLPSAIVSLSKELAESRTSATDTRINTTHSDSQLAEIEKQALAAYRIAVNTQEQRAYGHTLAILKRWPAQMEKTATILILLASVLQHEHQFKEALAHLDAALIKDSANAQAWLMRAQINLVVAYYNSARENCNVLSNLVQPAVSINCIAQVDALTGNAQSSLTLLENMLSENRDLSRQDYAELFISAASMAHRLGKPEDAIRYYNSVLQISPDQPYALVHYAQLLLEQSRFDDAISLFASRDERALPDEQKILYTRALLMSEKPDNIALAGRLKESLEENFNSAFMREEALPNKAYAQYALYIGKQPQEALVAARANWSLQKEPSDTLLLALAAQENDALAVLAVLARWIDAHHTEDVRLDKVFADNGVIR